MPSSPQPFPNSTTELSDFQQQQAELRYSMLEKTVLQNKYVKQVPTPKQALFLSLPEYREGFYGGAGGGGKALHLTTPLPTPLGWTKMQDVLPGDKLLDENGLPCTVTAISEIFYDHACYEIILNTGERIIADSGHEWNVGHVDAYADFDPTGRQDESPLHRTGKWLERSKLLTTKDLWAFFANARETGESIKNEICLLQRPQRDWSEGEKWFESLKDSDPLPMTSPIQTGREWAKMARRMGRDGNGKKKTERDKLPSVPFPQQVFDWPAGARANFLKGIFELATVPATNPYVFFPFRSRRDAQLTSDLLRTIGINSQIRPCRSEKETINKVDLWISTQSLASFGPDSRLDGHKAFEKNRNYRLFARISDVRRIDSVPVKCVSVDSPSHCYLAGRSQVATHNSSALLMAALQFVHIPGYSALILRRTFRDLNQPSALIPRSHEWLSNTDARWDAQNVRWRFPSGATVGFGYIEHDKDVYQFQGAEIQYCVARGTKVLTPAGDRNIEDIREGDLVCTLEGPRVVTKTHNFGIKKTIRAVTRFGDSVVSMDHRVMTPIGWVSPASLKPTGFPTTCTNSEASLERYPESRRLSETKYLDCTQPVLVSTESALEAAGREPSFWLADDRISDTGCSRQPQSVLRPASWFCRLRLCAPDLLRSLQESVRETRRRVPCHAGVDLEREGSMDGYSTAPDLCDGQAPSSSGFFEERIPSPDGVVELFPPYLLADDPVRTLGCNRVGFSTYTHPYTKETRSVSCEGAVQDALVCMGQEDEREVLDLTVEGASHYILSSGIISSNCAWDELTQFSSFPYTFMFSRLRKLLGTDLPLRVRGASNPGNKYAAWVKERFITNRGKDKFFIPATVYDNPHLDVEEYKRSLMEMDPINRERILNGDWDVSEEGTIFQKHWFNSIGANQLPKYQDMDLVRSWDLAATEPSEANPDPDWTVGSLMGRHRKTGEVVVIDVRMVRKNAGFVKRLVGDTARSDGRGVKVLIEQEPGSAGKALLQDYVNSLPGFNVRGVRPTGDKISRAIPMASAAEAGLVSMLLAPWRQFVMDQLGVFGSGVGHDDAVDALANGFSELTGGVRRWSPGDLQNLFSRKQNSLSLASPMEILQNKYGFGRGNAPPPSQR